MTILSQSVSQSVSKYVMGVWSNIAVSLAVRSRLCSVQPSLLTYVLTYSFTHVYLLYGQVELELEMLCETSDAFLDLVAGRPTNPMADRLAPVQPRTPVGA